VTYRTDRLDAPGSTRCARQTPDAAVGVASPQAEVPSGRRPTGMPQVPVHGSSVCSITVLKTEDRTSSAASVASLKFVYGLP
jgi:hypothetical protein